MDRETVAAIRKAIDESPMIADVQSELRAREAGDALRQGMFPQYLAIRAVMDERERRFRAEEK